MFNIDSLYPDACINIFAKTRDTTMVYDLVSVLNEGESYTVEFKEHPDNDLDNGGFHSDEYRKTIC